MTRSQKLLILLCLFSMNHIAAAMSHEDQSPLTGTWSAVCAPTDHNQYNIETFTFSGNKAVYSINLYSDPHCHHIISTLAAHRTYTLGGSMYGISNTRKLDYTFNSITMTYKNKNAVRSANANRAYGFSDWKLNQPKNVIGLKRSPSANPAHHVGEKFYTIVEIHKNRLYMGLYGSGTAVSDATRLSGIYSVPFVKQ